MHEKRDDILSLLPKSAEGKSPLFHDASEKFDGFGLLSEEKAWYNSRKAVFYLILIGRHTAMANCTTIASQLGYNIHIMSHGFVPPGKQMGGAQRPEVKR